MYDITLSIIYLITLHFTAWFSVNKLADINIHILNYVNPYKFYLHLSFPRETQNPIIYLDYLFKSYFI